MNCSQTEILIHALLDNELDSDHAIDVEAHLRICAACSEELVAFETTRKVVVQADLMEFAPVPLRKRLQLVPSLIVGAAAVGAPDIRYLSRRCVVSEMMLGVALSGAAAVTMLLACSLAWMMHVLK